MVRRVPIRLKLALAFAGVMAIVLAGTGGFIYVRQGADLNDALDQGLESRATDLVALVREADKPLAKADDNPLTEHDESFAQVLTREGEVIDAPKELRDVPLLAANDLVRARRKRITIARVDVPGSSHPARALAMPVKARGKKLIVVVATSLEDRRDAQRSLGALLLIGGPIALVIATLAGYGVAAAALRPVEAIRRRAAAIQVAGADARVPVAPARDEVRALGDTINAMLGRLERSFERERRFVADAAHELRTPLAILKTELELALRGERPADQLRAAITSAADETDRLTQLAEDLLVIARSDQGQLPVRLTPVGAAALLDGVRGRFAARAAEAGTSLAIDAPAGLELRADTLRLEQALGNMVDNALRHGAGAVVLSAREDAERGVVLTVADEGGGFTEAFAAEAFERFTRADDARGRGGAGLGLAIVAAIARAHGGAFGAGNRAGGGGEVWLSLPPIAPSPT